MEGVRNPGARRIAAAVYRRARGAIPRRPRPTILMYHRVADESFDPWGLAVSPAHFREQLVWLTRNRTLFPLVEFAERHVQRSLPKDAAALTFDDGYACSAEIAAPLLEEFRAPATIFIPADLIERGGPFWWDELQQVVLSHDGDSLAIDGQPVPLGPKQPDDHRWKPGAPPRTPRQAAFRRIWTALRDRSAQDLAMAMAGLRRQCSSPETGDLPRPMSPAQVRSTASERVAFGSHALTHPWLTSLEPAEQAREIGQSAARCEALVGSAPATFAYPYGNFDARSEGLVEKAGFVCACATIPSAVRPSDSVFALPRMQVCNWPAKALSRALARLA